MLPLVELDEENKALIDDEDSFHAILLASADDFVSKTFDDGVLDVDDKITRATRADACRAIRWLYLRRYGYWADIVRTTVHHCISY